MISMSDQLFKAGEEEEELTVYSHGFNYAQVCFVFFSFWATGTERISIERQREAACGRCCFVFLYKMNVCISGHWFSLVKSSLTTYKPMVSLGKGGGGVSRRLVLRTFKDFLRRLSAPWLAPLSETAGRTPTQPDTATEDNPSSLAPRQTSLLPSKVQLINML